MNSTQRILASTSLTLNPLSIIRLYSCRFRIECTFRELKQQTGAFSCHFWSKHMPRLNYCQKKGDPFPLECVKEEKPREKVLTAVRALEMHMALSCIAMGILQGISICFIGKVSPDQLRYQRTPSKGRMSEATVIHYLRRHFFRLSGQNPELHITQIIQEQQNESGIY